VSRGVPIHPANGEEQRFREAAVDCLNGLYGFALSLCRDSAVADDLVQETYARALAARRKANPEENLRVWLFVILHNVWRNQRRRPRPDRPSDHPEILLELPDRRERPDEQLDRERLRLRLRDAIDTLPESFRQVVVLRCVEGFSYQEVAEVVGCPTGTVMSRLARGRALLRERLRPSLAARSPRERIS
jgi:RNA polymerase sigma-70 factor (ECF subfamily)